MKLPAWISWSRKLLLLPPLIVGGVVLGSLLALKADPQKELVAEVGRPMRVLPVARLDVVPRAIGYGTAEPGTTWRAVAEVKGRLITVNDDLESGAMIPAKTLLVEIDPTEYDLTIKQLQAEIAQIEAELRELEFRKINDGKSLEIEKASLALANSDLQRHERLRARDAITQAVLDSKRREVLSQRQLVQQLQNSLDLIPAQSDALTAAQQAKQARLQQAERDRKKTQLLAPFDGRVGPVSVEVGQFVGVGEVLFEVQSVAVMEVQAQLTLGQLKDLLPPPPQGETRPFPIPFQRAQMRRIFNFQEILVRQRLGDLVAQWSARFDRVREQIDPQTRTLALVVAVDHPFKKAIPGKRPPLVQGAFCEVEIRGQTRPNTVVIPREALWGETVYLLDAQNRLRRREVVVDFAQGDFVAVAGGLEGGETLVVADPTPGIEGTLIKPIVDQQRLASLTAEATLVTPEKLPEVTASTK